MLYTKNNHDHKVAKVYNSMGISTKSFFNLFTKLVLGICFNFNPNLGWMLQLVGEAHFHLEQVHSWQHVFSISQTSAQLRKKKIISPTKETAIEI